MFHKIVPITLIQFSFLLKSNYTHANTVTKDDYEEKRGNSVDEEMKYWISQSNDVTGLEISTQVDTRIYQEIEQSATVTGLEETLPDLRQERRGHGCGSYIKDGKKVFQTFMKYLVAGGYSFLGTLFSTEIWSPGDSSWTTVSPLPRAVAYTESVSLNNRIYLFGKIIQQIVQQIHFLYPQETMLVG